MTIEKKNLFSFCIFVFTPIYIYKAETCKRLHLFWGNNSGICDPHIGISSYICTKVI